MRSRFAHSNQRRMLQLIRTVYLQLIQFRILMLGAISNNFLIKSLNHGHGVCVPRIFYWFINACRNLLIELRLRLGCRTKISPKISSNWKEHLHATLLTHISLQFETSRKVVKFVRAKKLNKLIHHWRKPTQKTNFNFFLMTNERKRGEQKLNCF